jgi:2-dehydropantoate 2-reductase
LKIVIMGAGAIGSLFGGLLAKAGNEVSFVGRKPHIDEIHQKGLLIEGISGEHHIKLKVTTDASKLQAPDLIILTVKAYATAQAVQDVKPLFKDHTYFLCLQNGLGTEDVASSILGQDRILRGTTSEGVLFLEPGKIRHTGHGETIIGSSNPDDSSILRQIQQEFQKAGFNTTVSSNIKRVVWEKIFVNVAINPFGALTGLRNGELLTIPEIKEAMKAAVLEGVTVTEKLGVQLSEQSPVERAFEVARKTAQNKNSMLQDIEKQKKTEIDFINGALVRYGETVGISCPINAVLTALIKGLEKRNELTSVEAN